MTFVEDLPEPFDNPKIFSATLLFLTVFLYAFSHSGVPIQSGIPLDNGYCEYKINNLGFVDSSDIFYTSINDPSKNSSILYYYLADSALISNIKYSGISNLVDNTSHISYSIKYDTDDDPFTNEVLYIHSSIFSKTIIFEEVQIYSDNKFLIKVYDFVDSKNTNTEVFLFHTELQGLSGFYVHYRGYVDNGNDYRLAVFLKVYFQIIITGD